MVREELILRTYSKGDDTDAKFHDIVITEYDYESSRMGMPTIKATIYYPKCLDKEWDGTQYITFRGEQFFIHETPDSTKSNDTAMYKHEVTFRSGREILSNVLFYDVVPDHAELIVNKPKSDSTTTTFYGTLAELSERINCALLFAGVGDSILKKKTNLYYGIDEPVGDGYCSMVDALGEAGLYDPDQSWEFSFEDSYISEAIDSAYETCEVPFEYHGKQIIWGKYNTPLTHKFQYGVENELLSVSKNNANNRVINRITFKGGDTNIPYYYPNETEFGKVTAIADSSNKVIKASNLSVKNETVLAQRIPEGSKAVYTQVDVTTDVTGGASLYIGYIGAGENEGKNTFGSETLNNWVLEQLTTINTKYYYIFFALNEADSKTDINLSFHAKTGRHYQFQNPSTDTGIVEYKDVALIDCKEVKLRYLGQNTPSNDAWDNGSDYSSYLDLTNSKVKGLTKTGNYLIRIRIDCPQSPTNNYYYYTLVDTLELSYTLESYKYMWAVSSKLYSDLSYLGLATTATLSEKAVGDTITTKIDTEGRIAIQTNLMPPKYRQTSGAERFYNAHNNTYTDPDTNKYYEFSHPYIDGAPNEYIYKDEDIYPTIEGVTNAKGLLLGEIAAIAYDSDDNDLLKTDASEDSDTDSSSYQHSYFYIKLHLFDGDYGFSLFDSASQSDSMTLQMISGNCNGCKFKVQATQFTDENGYYTYGNPVKVKTANGDIVDGSYSDKVSGETASKDALQSYQQDTTKNSIWICVQKDAETFGVIMPNKTNNYVPAIGDKFNIININLPQAYIDAAEKRGEEEMLRYMADNNEEKFTFDIEMSRIFFAQNPDVLEKLDENSRIIVVYDGVEYTLYVSNFKISCKNDSALPEVSVELSDEITVGESFAQNVADRAASLIANAYTLGGSTGKVTTGGTSSAMNVDVLRKIFLSKTDEDTAEGHITFKQGLRSEKTIVSSEGVISLGSIVGKEITATTSVKGETVSANEVSGSSAEFNSANISSLTATTVSATSVSSETVEASDSVSAKTVSATDSVTAKTVSASATVSGNKVSATDSVTANSVSAKTITATDSVTTKTLTTSSDASIGGDLTVTGDASADNLNATNEVSANSATIADTATAKTLKATDSVICATGQFSNAITGVGMGAGIVKESNRYNGYFDNIYVREAIHAITLVNEKLNTVSLGLLISAAHGTVSSTRTSTYALYVTLQDKDMEFAVGDWVRWSAVDFNAATFTQRTGWLYCSAISNKTLTLISKDGSAISVTAPSAGDTLVLCGSDDEDRQSAIFLTVGDGKPRITLYNGIGSDVDATTKLPSMSGCEQAIMGDLNGINDGDFGALKGYGLYAQTAYIKGLLRVINKDGSQQSLEDFVNANVIVDEGAIVNKVFDDTRYTQLTTTVNGINATVSGEDGKSGLSATVDKLSSYVINDDGSSVIEQTANSITEAITGDNGSLTKLAATVDGINTSVSNIQGDYVSQSTFKEKAGSIEASVKKIQDDYVTSSDLTATADAITASVESEIVRPNLLKRTADSSLFSVISNGSMTGTITDDGESYEAAITKAGSYNYIVYDGVGAGTLEKDAVYTLSFEAIFDAPTANYSINCIVADKNSANYVLTSKTFAVTSAMLDTTYHKVEITFDAAKITSLASSVLIISFGTMSVADASMRVRHLKIEKGKNATAWTDSASDIVYNAAQLKVNADKITSTVETVNGYENRISTVEQTASELNVTINGDGSSAGLKLTTDRITTTVDKYIGDSGSKLTSNIEQTVQGMTVTVDDESKNLLTQVVANAQGVKVNASDISKLNVSVDGISAKVKTYDVLSENLFPYPYWNKQIGSNGYFQQGSSDVKLNKPTQAGQAVTIRLRGRFGRYMMRIYYAYAWKASVTLYGSQHKEVLAGTRTADYTGGTDDEVIEYTFTSADTYSDDTNKAVFVVFTSDDSGGTIDTDCILKSVIVAQTDNLSMGTLLKETGIDIAQGEVTVTSDNFKVQNNDGVQTALIDESGKLTVSLIDVINLAAQKVYAMISGSDYPVSSLNADGDGAYVIYYPNTTQQMMRICPTDSTGESVIQFFDTDGLELWHIGKSASFVTGEYSWETVTIATLTAKESTALVNYMNTDKVSTAYVYHCSTDSKYADYNNMWFTNNLTTPDKCTKLAQGTYYSPQYYGGLVNQDTGLATPYTRKCYVINPDGVKKSQTVVFLKDS